MGMYDTIVVEDTSLFSCSVGHAILDLQTKSFGCYGVWMTLDCAGYLTRQFVQADNVWQPSRIVKGSCDAIGYCSTCDQYLEWELSFDNEKLVGKWLREVV